MMMFAQGGRQRPVGSYSCRAQAQTKLTHHLVVIQTVSSRSVHLKSTVCMAVSVHLNERGQYRKKTRLESFSTDALYSHLTSVAGGCTPHSQARKHAADVARFLEVQQHGSSTHEVERPRGGAFLPLLANQGISGSRTQESSVPGSMGHLATKPIRSRLLGEPTSTGFIGDTREG